MTRKQTKLRKKRQTKQATKAPKAAKVPEAPKAQRELKDVMRGSLRRHFSDEDSYAAAMEKITQEMSQCVIDAVKEQKATEYQKMDGSCHIPEVGTFHLYRYRDNDYHLMFEHTAYENDPILECGRQIQRFLHPDPTTLLVQFYDYDELVLITTKDNWKTIHQERQPKTKLNSYLDVKNPFPYVAMHDNESLGDFDMAIFCEDGPFSCLNSSVLIPRWPQLESMLNGSNFIDMEEPLGLVAHWTTLLYGHHFDYQEYVMVVAQLLDLAIDYDIPEVVRMTSHLIYSADMTQLEAFTIWQLIWESNEEVAVYCAQRTKNQHGKDGRSMDEELMRHFVRFVIEASAEEQEAFDKHHNPSVPLPRIGSHFFDTTDKN